MMVEVEVYLYDRDTKERHFISFDTEVNMRFYIEEYDRVMLLAKEIIEEEYPGRDMEIERMCF